MRHYNFPVRTNKEVVDHVRDKHESWKAHSGTEKSDKIFRMWFGKVTARGQADTALITTKPAKEVDVSRCWIRVEAVLCRTITVHKLTWIRTLPTMKLYGKDKGKKNNSQKKKKCENCSTFPCWSASTDALPENTLMRECQH